MIEELFAPGRKHTDEERKRLELTRVDLNDGDPGRGPIDLASGKVVVRLPTQAGDETEPETEAKREAESDPAATPDQAQAQAPATVPGPATAPTPTPTPAPAPEEAPE
ncbi:DUF6191 domain-containing protein [Streptomyces phaeochromogenes]